MDIPTTEPQWQTYDLYYSNICTPRSIKVRYCNVTDRMQIINETPIPVLQQGPCCVIELDEIQTDINAYTEPALIVMPPYVTNDGTHIPAHAVIARWREVARTDPYWDDYKQRIETEKQQEAARAARLATQT